jgi:hypothetical protein
VFDPASAPQKRIFQLGLFVLIRYFVALKRYYNLFEKKLVILEGIFYLSMHIRTLKLFAVVKYVVSFR